MLALPGAAVCQFRNKSILHWSRYICIDTSEIDGMSETTVANPGIIGSTTVYARKQAYFWGKTMQMYLQFAMVSVLIVPHLVWLVPLFCKFAWVPSQVLLVVQT